MLVPSSNGTNIPPIAGIHRKPVAGKVQLLDHQRVEQPDEVGAGRDPNPGQASSMRAGAADPVAGLQHQDPRPARARYAAQVSPLCPAPTTIASQRRAASSETGCGRPIRPRTAAVGWGVE